MDGASHATPLISLIVGGFVLAFLLGALAHRFKISPLVGYLVAGVLLGPFTPGFVASQELAAELAEVGVILLMFGVGMHLSLKELLAVRQVAIPGAVVQIVAATLLGLGVALFIGWSVTAGLVFGLCLSVASTVVLIRAVDDQGLIDTERGRIAIGWLIVEDLAMVLALVFLPALAESLSIEGDGRPASAVVSELAMVFAVTIGKVALFIGFMLIVGRRVIPAVLHYVAWTGSRELFRLAVLGIALGVAFGAAQLFGVSFALGAFFAGMVLAESELSQRAAEETLPLRDAFAVLFFVSVGMLFNPSTLMEHPWKVVATLFIILFGKSLAAYLIVRAFGRTPQTALTISASLAQIGEFSFILSALALSLGLLPAEGRDLIITGAILSIMVNPLWFRALTWWENRSAAPVLEPEPAPQPPLQDKTVSFENHAVIVGFGRVGAVVADGFKARGISVAVVEERQELIEAARAQGFTAFRGNASQPGIGARVNLAKARWLIVAVPNGFEAAQIVEHARAANPTLKIFARAHFDAEVDLLKLSGADFTVMGEREIAKAFLDEAAATA